MDTLVDADLLTEEDAVNLAYETRHDAKATFREKILARLVERFLDELVAERAGEDL